MDEAHEELADFITDLALWISEQMGGPDVLSLEDFATVRTAVVYFGAWLQEAENRRRLSGLLGRAGWDTLDS